MYQTRVGANVQVFTVRPGRGRRRLTHFRDGDSINAAWSPDGSKIAFLHVTKERGERQRI